MKKIKVEVESHRLSNSRNSLHEEPHSRPSSPDKTQRIPHGAPNAPLVSYLILDEVFLSHGVFHHIRLKRLKLEWRKCAL